MVDGNTSNHQRGSQNKAWKFGIILAVIAAIGWYLYLAEKDKAENVTRDSELQIDELQAEIRRLSQDQSALQSELDRERETRQQTQESFDAEREALTQLRQALAMERETAAQLQSELELSRQERELLERNLKQELDLLASESARVERELQQRLVQQQALNDQVNAANAEKQQLTSHLEQAQDKRQQLLLQIAAVNDDVRAKQGELSAARQEQDQLKIRLTELSEQQKAEAAHFEVLRQRLEGELQESRVTITQLKNRMTVINLTSEVLFDSGSARIKPAGSKVLDLIASSLNAYPNRAISIEGHTDNVPIGKHSSFVSNWELSVARALAAVDQLQRQNKVAAQRLRVVGHGEFHPVESNDSAEGRQLNRRIEIRLLPEPEQDS